MSESVNADYSNVRITKVAQANPPHETRCAIYGNTCAKGVDYLTHLVSIAKADYPRLLDKDIKIVIYGGQSTKFHMGIEFNVRDVADGYRDGTLEYTLS